MSGSAAVIWARADKLAKRTAMGPLPGAWVTSISVLVAGPVALVMVTATGKTPASSVVPLMMPESASMLRPDGRPLALKVACATLVSTP